MFLVFYYYIKVANFAIKPNLQLVFYGNYKPKGGNVYIVPKYHKY